jgi:hypothetical protein
MQMLCIKGTQRTNTKAGRIYDCVGRFVCQTCGFKSPILEFAEPVESWPAISCLVCGTEHKREARYAHEERFIRLNGDDGFVTREDVGELIDA